MFRKLGLRLGLLEEVEDEEQPREIFKQESEKEYIERRRLELEKETEAKKEEEEKPKVKLKYIMFKESDEEKERRKNYFRNLIDGYERVKGKKLIRKHFVDNIPEKQEHFHGFLRSTHTMAKIEAKLNIDENKKLKKLLYSHKHND